MSAVTYFKNLANTLTVAGLATSSAFYFANSGMALPDAGATPAPGVGTPTSGGGAVLPGTGLPGGAGMVNPGAGGTGIPSIPTAPTIDPSTGQVIPNPGGGAPGTGLPGMGTPGGGVPGEGTPGTGLPGGGSPGGGGAPTNQVPPQIVNQLLLQEAIAVIQNEAPVIQAEAHGKFDEDLKLDKWDRKVRQTRQQHNLGVLYTMGIGVPLNFESAYKYFQLAADEGLPQAQFNVAIALQKGMGTPKDFVRSYKFYTLAAAQGLPGAGKARDDLAQYLSQFQIRAGSRMALGFKRQLDAKKKFVEEQREEERKLYEALGRRPPDFR